MLRYIHVPLIIVLVTLHYVQVHAGNNSGQAFSFWPDTGQTTCYNATGFVVACPAPTNLFYGQDAQYDGPFRSYTKLDASGNPLAESASSWAMVRDNVTGLIWEAKEAKNNVADYVNPHDADNTYTWCDTDPNTNGGNSGTCGTKDTEDFVTALNGSAFGGHADWRLPTIKELQTLVDRGQSSPPFNITYFPDTVLGGGYWSATTNLLYTNFAWVVDSSSGGDGYNDKYDNFFVRAVRGGQVPSENRFEVNTSTVTDTVTCLEWQRATSTQMNWQSALAYAEGLSLDGHTDWRLPNINELTSIVDYSRYDPAIDTTAFPDTVPFFYWSSTTNAYPINTSYVWLVYFSSGRVYPYPKLDSHYVRAVRGSQCGPLTCFVDMDHDGYGSTQKIYDDGDGVCEAADGESSVNTDCNDGNASIHPGATEVVANGVDGDCDGYELCYADLDNDSYRPDGTTTVISDDLDCTDSTEATSSDPIGDCNDADAGVHPGAAEICDGLDNDCNTSIDNLPAPFNTLQQGVCSGSKQTCMGVGGWVDDYSGIVTYEAGFETTCDTLDNDCDGTVDEALTTTYYQDSDIDNYGNPSVSQNTCSQPAGYVQSNTDCNDSNAAIHPGATELPADGVDQDCDTQELCYADWDNDGYRPDAISTVTSADMDCTDSTEATSSDPIGDCNDMAPGIHPGAVEICDGVDNNCDGNIDDGVKLTWYLDSDQDGYGDAGSSIQACSLPPGYVASNTDCNDADALEHPNQTWYKDEDGDGYSDGTMMISCQRPENYYAASELIRISGDPDDTDPDIIPSVFPWPMFMPAIQNQSNN